jgi:hypothetical protein
MFAKLEKVCWALVPWRIKIRSHYKAKEWTNWRRCGKFGTEQKSLECDTHKNVRANRVKVCKQTTKKLRATNYLFKVEHCGSSLLTSNRKIWGLGKLLISKWNHKQKSAVEVVANGVHTAKLETESQLRRRKREWLALIAADVWVWVYKSTVYNTKGGTWSGSPLWKQAQQEVRQHWFMVW